MNRKKEEVVVGYYAFSRASEKDQLRLVQSVDNHGRIRFFVPLLKASPNDHILSIGKKDCRQLNRIEIINLLPKKKDSLMKIVILKNPKNMDFLNQVRHYLKLVHLIEGRLLLVF